MMNEPGAILKKQNSEWARNRIETLPRIRLFLSKAMLLISLSSIVLMIVDTQLILDRVYPVCSETSITVKKVGTGITTVLILLIIAYNFVQLEIHMAIRNIKNICMGMQVNMKRNFLLILEIIVTIPHPLPYCFGYGRPPENPANIPSDKEIQPNTTTTMHTTHINNETTGANHTIEPLYTRVVKLSSIEAVLSILMFARLYQIARFTVLHSYQFRTTLSYGLGALAQTKYNFLFIFKSVMSIYRGYFLGALALVFSMIASWCIYICDSNIATFKDSLWVVIITFFTVGYGDITPGSKCSQSIAVMTGFSGMFCMGVSITILSRYLQLTYDEYCMLSFIIEADLQKQLKEVSARIIQAAWRQHTQQKTTNSLAIFRAQRELIKAMHVKKRIQNEKVTSRERRQKQVPLYDMKEQMKKLTIRTDHVIIRNQGIIHSMATIRSTLQIMQERLSLLFKLIQNPKRRTSKSAILPPIEAQIPTKQ